MSEIKNDHIGFLVKILSANLVDYAEGKSDHNDSTFIIEIDEGYITKVQVSVTKKKSDAK